MRGIGVVVIVALSAPVSVAHACPFSDLAKAEWFARTLELRGVLRIDGRTTVIEDVGVMKIDGGYGLTINGEPADLERSVTFHDGQPRRLIDEACGAPLRTAPQQQPGACRVVPKAIQDQAECPSPRSGLEVCKTLAQLDGGWELSDVVPLEWNERADDATVERLLAVLGHSETGRALIAAYHQHDVRIHGPNDEVALTGLSGLCVQQRDGSRDVYLAPTTLGHAVLNLAHELEHCTTENAEPLHARYKQLVTAASASSDRSAATWQTVADALTDYVVAAETPAYETMFRVGVELSEQVPCFGVFAEDLYGLGHGNWVHSDRQVHLIARHRVEGVWRILERRVPFELPQPTFRSGDPTPWTWNGRTGPWYHPSR